MCVEKGECVLRKESVYFLSHLRGGPLFLAGEGKGVYRFTILLSSLSLFLKGCGNNCHSLAPLSPRLALGAGRQYCANPSAETLCQPQRPTSPSITPLQTHTRQSVCSALYSVSPPRLLSVPNTHPIPHHTHTHTHTRTHTQRDKMA